jgi:hypothetical protein
MATSSVWASAGNPEGFLCIHCLERRLGRALTARDFADLPVNWPHPWQTRLLATRLAED